MSATRFLATDKLASWLATVAATRQVLAPRQEGKAVVFRPLTAGETPSLKRTTISPKAAILPPCETLLTYTGVKDPEVPGKLSLSLDDTPQAGPQLVFGCRSCDARGFVALDHPYLKGKFVDPYYKARREQTLIVTQTCNNPCATCFCHWTGGSPIDSTGSDIIFTNIDGGYVFEAISEKGEALLAEMQAPEATDEQLAAVTEAREKAVASQEPAPDITASPKRLADRFTDMAFWQAQTGKCLSCGACTYMCPTCQCFNITDEGDSLNGRRLRSWDNCMSSQFTREASGHNPRANKAMRMRNRVSHKYWYSPEYNEGLVSCTGCGRCVRQCPVSLDIREIVLNAIASDAE